MKEIKKLDKLYFVAVLIGLGSFALPSYNLIMDGTHYKQFFINTYGGKLIFGNLLLFGLLVQALFYNRVKKTSAWLSLICGVYSSFYGANQLWNCKIRFKPDNPTTLASTMQVGSVAMAGIWVLLFAGIAVLIIAAIKLANKSLFEKKLAHAAN